MLSVISCKLRYFYAGLLKYVINMPNCDFKMYFTLFLTCVLSIFSWVHSRPKQWMHCDSLMANLKFNIHYLKRRMLQKIMFECPHKHMLNTYCSVPLSDLCVELTCSSSTSCIELTFVRKSQLEMGGVGRCWVDYNLSVNTPPMPSVTHRLSSRRQ